MRSAPGLDTIVAIATPAGRGGIGIVRISGPMARAIAEPMLRLARPLEAGRARFGELLDRGATGADGQPVVLDQAVATFFAAPHSYTADDVVEIAMHGAPVLLETVLRGAMAAGARLAEPGEFTQRAFLSGRIDLTSAEAVRDLIDSSTLHQARVAAAQLGGSVSRAVAPVKRELVTLIAALEAGIDFAEDDIDTLAGPVIREWIGRVLEPLLAMSAGFAFGRTVREGFVVALAGRPNAGKSSLFNRLLGRERAIVTAQPGTTRDLLQEQLEIAGIPVELVDTAGLRELAVEDAHEAELAGIARTRVTLAEAHHVLVIVDSATMDEAGAGLLPEDRVTVESLAGRPFTVVLNKTDLVDVARRTAMQGAMPRAVLVSAVTGDGVEGLRERLERVLAVNAPAIETTLVTNVRQQQAILGAIASLEGGFDASGRAIPHEMLLLDLYAGLRSLDELTGTTTTEDILHEIFGSFCIGK